MFPADLARSVCAGAVVLVVALALLGGAAHAAPTYVSLQFDDGYADQSLAAQMLADRGMHGVFYVNSDLLGGAGLLTYEQLRQMQADGHEIGGHTLTHPNLPTLSPARQQRQICTDRTHLLSHGLAANAFAYPFGARDDTTIGLARDCGYDNARQVGGLAADCGGCPYALSVPPAERWSTPAEEIQASTTLEQIEAYVTGAQAHGGGWVQIYTHHVCDDCGDYAVAPATLAGFLDWLQGREGPSLRVRTNAEVLAGADAPAVSIAAPAPGAHGSGVVTVTAATNAPAGVRRVRFLVDGRQLGTRTKAPFRWKWRTASAGPGAHALTVLVEDGNGYAAASGAVAFTVTP
jgi:peptidoglycan/xylan/chitin deacetylase (PgdA/CDA1 family)